MLLLSALNGLQPATADASASLNATTLTGKAAPGAAPAAQQPRLDKHAALPLSFEPNVGQTDRAVSFLVRSKASTLFFSDTGIALSLGQPQQLAASAGKTGAQNGLITAAVSRISFANSAATLRIEGAAPLPGKANYFIGNDPAKWRTDLPTYAAVVYKNLYAGIDLRYEGSSGQLKGTYTIAPGANPTVIRWRHSGAAGEILQKINAAGQLTVQLPAIGASAPITITEGAPTAWQEVAGQKKPVSVRYVLNLDGTIGFLLGAYDRSVPLIIDPTVSYTTYLGGSTNEYGDAVAVDPLGNTYVAGEAYSTGYPSVNPVQSYADGIDVVVSKLSADGSTLLYSTYLGGDGYITGQDDFPRGIAVDASGAAFITGGTKSSHYPTENPYQDHNASVGFGYQGVNVEDVFVTKLNPSGSSLAYSTYLGGSYDDRGQSIALDSAGNAYIAGWTTSNDFPLAGQTLSAASGGKDAFVAEFSADGIHLLSSTYYGDNSDDEALGIAVDASGASYVVGDTSSTNFCAQPSLQGDATGIDAFVLKVGANSTYCTYLGGSGSDFAFGVAVDALGSAYVAGYTDSSDFNSDDPVLGQEYAGGIDAFMARLAPNGASLTSYTYLGGSQVDQAFGIALNNAGDIYVTGYTNSNDFHVVNPVQATYGGLGDAFVALLDSYGLILYATYLGDSDVDSAQGVAADASGYADIVGYTYSSDFPTFSAIQSGSGGGSDIFVSKIYYDDASNTPDAAELRCGGSPSERPTTQEAGDAVNTATGYYCYSSLELSIAGRGAGLAFQPTYNSDLATHQGSLGYGWTHNYDMYVEQQPTAPFNYYVHEENATVVAFDQNFVAAPRVLATLSYDSGSDEYTFTRTHGQMRFIFGAVSNGATSAYKLKRIINLNGYIVQLDYDNQGRLATATEMDNPADVSDPVNRKLSFSYSNSSSVVINQVAESIPTSNGIAHTNRTVGLHYLSSGDLDYIQDVAGQQTSFAYDATHELQSVTEPRNGASIAVVTNTFDTLGRVTKQDYPMSRFLTLEYSGGAANFSTKLTNTLGLVTVNNYFYNKLTQVVELPGAGQAVWNYSYKLGTTWLEAVTDPASHTWLYTWDDLGNCLSVTDPLHNSTTYTYTALNKVHSVTDADQFTTTYNYEAHGNVNVVLRQWVEQGHDTITFYMYDTGHPGDLKFITDARTNVWAFTHDTYGYSDLTKNPTAVGGITDYDYDGAGRLRRVTDANNNQTNYDYNERNQLAEISDALTNSTSYDYDAIGNLHTLTDANNNPVVYDYDDNNELIKVTQPDNSYTTTGYDGLGRVATQSNGLHVTTASYTYHDTARSVDVFDALNKKTQYFYDLTGLLVKTIDANNNTTDYSYWANNWLRHIAYHDSAHTPDVDFGYNGRGLRTSMVDGTGTTNYTYDSLGQLTLVDRLNELVPNGGNVETQVGYEYDAVGNTTKITYPQRAGIPTPLTVSRHFDAANRLDTLTMSVPYLGDTTTGFGYDLNGNLTSVDYVTATANNSDAQTVLSYDELNLLSSRTDSNNTGELYYVGYTRDPKHLVATADEREGGSSLGTTHSYAYNSLDQLTQDTFTNANDPTTDSLSAWNYDAAGQLGQSVVTVSGQTAVTTTRSYDNAGQLTSFAEIQGSQTNRDYGFGYDFNGNRTVLTATLGGANTSYSFDTANRLLSADGNTTTYRYDGDGLRRFKCVATSCANQQVWDSAGGTPLLLQDQRANFVYGPGGMPLAEVVDENGTPVTHYYLLDQQGSIRMLLNDTGSVEKTYLYNAYGQKTELDPTPYNPLGYVGQYEDEESNQGQDASGLLYMRSRYYDPLTQQFLSRDSNGSGLEPYGYAAGNPVNFSDVNGASPSFSSMFQSDQPGDEAAQAARSATQLKTFYHGTNSIYAANIRTQGIDLERGRDKLDFNPANTPGFYVTSIRAQAVKWATRVVRQNGGVPNIVEFNIPSSEFAELRGKVFEEADDEWAQFVLAGRANQLRFAEPYDYVSGPVYANLPFYPRALIDTYGMADQTAIFTSRASDLFNRYRR